jgi:hypothetical protein
VKTSKIVSINGKKYDQNDAQLSVRSFSASLAGKDDLWVVPVDLPMFWLTLEVRPETAG